MHTKYDIIIIGAGASGLAAAVEASRAGASVLVLEKNHVPGRKILSTGAGKCNFSNLKIAPAAYHPGPAAFLKKAFAALPPKEVLKFFESLGLLWTEGEDGKLFPRSMKAQDVANALLNELAARTVRIQTLTEVTGLAAADGGFTVDAQKVPPQWDKKSARGEKVSFSAGRVILAAGGPCYPQIGGTDSGQALLLGLGHTVSPFSPAIVPLQVRESFVKELDGVRLEAELKLLAGRKPATVRDELLFTACGISGPAALALSRAALAALELGPVIVAVDFFPDLKLADLECLVLARAELFSGRSFAHCAAGLHNEKLLKVIAGLAGIPWTALAGQADREALLGFASLLKAFPLEIAGPTGYEDAMVASGGCAVSEVDPVTFCSKKVKGLHITGELLDVDGDSGGYNLHFAWTSGILAARAAAGR